MKDMPQPQYALDPADELAEICEKMTRLKARAEELRLGFITCEGLSRVGQRHRVEVMVQKAQIFDAKLLPAEVRNDSRFLRTRITRFIKTLPIEPELWDAQRVDPAGDAIKSALARWEAMEAPHPSMRQDHAVH
jgi:hypothetical protein